MGTGAGFPGIPLKIYCPSIKIVLMDSLAKRLKFLQTVIEQLGLEEITCEHIRAEDAGHKAQHREHYDIAIARAVAPLAVLAEYCLPLVKSGGFFYAMKGSKYKDEFEWNSTFVMNPDRVYLTDAAYEEMIDKIKKYL